MFNSKEMKNLVDGPEFKIEMEYGDHELKRCYVKGDGVSLLTALDLITEKLISKKIPKSALLASVFESIDCTDEEIMKAQISRKFVTGLLRNIKTSLENDIDDRENFIKGFSFAISKDDIKKFKKIFEEDK